MSNMTKQSSLPLQASFDLTLQGIEQISLSESSSSHFSYTIQGTAHLEHVRALETWLEAYLEGRSCSLPLLTNPRIFTAFTQLVFRKLNEIPFGKAISYEELAHRCDSRAFRAVGGACGKNPWPLLVPCHRVVGKNGSLRGFSSGGTRVKEILLAFEGRNRES